MAEWTGVMYGFYTNKPLEDVFSSMAAKVKPDGYQHQRNSVRDEEFLLFYKDEEMLNYHLEKGYNLDIGGEGCFCIEAKSATLNGAATLFEFENDSDFEPYDINLRFNHIYYYVLILPDFIDSADFCQKIYNLFVNVLEEN